MSDIVDSDIVDSGLIAGRVGASVPVVVDVLLVEDDAGDVLLVDEALAEAGRGRLAACRGRRARGFGVPAARRRARHAPRPGLILPDLNLPGLDGRDVLAQVKADETLRSIPVVVLTSSQAEQDVTGSYEAHATPTSPNRSTSLTSPPSPTRSRSSSPRSSSYPAETCHLGLGGSRLLTPGHTAAALGCW